jgi:hypothetical protein
MFSFCFSPKLSAITDYELAAFLVVQQITSLPLDA